MGERLIISISGMRGIVGENLTGSVASEYGGSFGAFLKEQDREKRGSLSVCIGRDSRPSGPTLQAAVMQGLCDVGIDVIDVGLATTPGVGVALRELGCDGGVVITASHNPNPYNGIKLLLGNGMAATKAEAEQIKKFYLEGRRTVVDPVNVGKVTINEHADAIHVGKILEIVSREAIAAKRFKVVLDSVNGAGGPITKKLLVDEFACRVVPMNTEPTGQFAHTPEPIAENLGGLCQAVKAEGADLGFAQDPDADRLAVVDENGSYIGEEYTLALAAKYVLSKTGGSVATNLSTSRMVDDVAKEAGSRVFRTPVGEANVAAAMVEHNCVIGGEGNGGVIDLRVGGIRDSLVGIAFVLQLMADTGKTVSQLVAEIGGYYMSKDKFPAEAHQAEQIIAAAKEAFAEANIDTTDGCRFDFDDGWFHLRSSNTEPVMRLIVEARDEATARKYVDAIMKIRQESKG